MPRIQVNPEKLRTLSAELQRTATNLRATEVRAVSAWKGLDFEARHRIGVDDQVKGVRSHASELIAATESLSRYLTVKAQVFEDADRQGAQELNLIVQQHPIPVLTPTPSEEEVIEQLSLEKAVKVLDDLLKPIDWIGKSEKATMQFHETFKEIGRVLNSITGTRGHIKFMDEFAGLLSGTGKAVSAISNLLDLKDFHEYFAGELTNQEIATTAIDALIPIPIVNAKISKWMTENMLNPTGKWHGLAPSAE